MKFLTSATFVAALSLVGSTQAFVVVSPASVHARSFSSSTTQLYGILSGFRKAETKEWKQEAEDFTYPKPQYGNVVIDSDVRPAVFLLALGIGLDLIPIPFDIPYLVPYGQWAIGTLIAALGLVLYYQTFRVRFVFDDENCVELKSALVGSELKDTGDNPVVGGKNRWSCDNIVNYDFFPQSWIDPNHPIGPLLIYFKETQTDESKWKRGVSSAANDPVMIAKGKVVPGQFHLFPVVCNAQQFKEQLEKRGVEKV